jgi:hypothetical protein
VRVLRQLQEKNLLLRPEEFREYKGTWKSALDVDLEGGELRKGSDGAGLDAGEYMKVARMVRCGVDPALLARLDRIHALLEPLSRWDRFGRTEELLDYIQALHALTVPWEPLDRKIVGEIEEALFTEGVSPEALLGRDRVGEPSHLPFLEMLAGEGLQGDSQAGLWASLGVGAGLLFAVAAISVVLNVPSLFTLIVPVLCTIALGALWGWWAFAAGTLLGILFFPFRPDGLGMTEVIVDFLYLALVGMAGGARLGARIGGRREVLSTGARICRTYNGRITEVLTAEK